MTRRSASCIALVTLLATGCSDAPVVLEVDGIGYTEAELIGLSESRRDLLRAITAFGLMLADQTEDEVFAPVVALGRDAGVHELALAEGVVADAGLEDAALRERYLAAPAYELTVRHLIVMSPRWETDQLRDAARGKAASALERVQAGESFPEVAAEVSEEPGAEGRQGLLAPGREGAWVDEFWGAASALEVGGISGVVETQYGFHVLRLEGRDTVPFAEARARVVLETARALGMREPLLAEAPRPAEPTFPTPFGEVSDTAAVLAAWEGGEVRWTGLRDRAAAEGGVTWDAFVEGDPVVAGRLLDLEMARAAAVRAAADAGIEADDLPPSAPLEDLIADAAATAQLLGIPPAPARSTVKEVALAALGTPGQNADLARGTVREWRGLLARLYDPILPVSETAGSSDP